MHRTIRPYELFEPSTIDQASMLLKKYQSEAKVLAGGLDLVSKMRRWQTNPKYLISIRNIKELKQIKNYRQEGIEIGAMVSLHDVELSAIVKERWPVLHEAVHQIASIQVKTMGTMVGNLCVATPASDIAPILFVLGAKLKVNSVSDQKIIPVDAFFIPVCQHILKPDELVTSVILPEQPNDTVCAFMKLAHTAACIAKINVAVSISKSGDFCKDARIALGAVAPCVIRARQAEEILKDSNFNEKTIDLACYKASEEATPISDLRSTAKYRRKMVEVLVRRAINHILVKLKQSKGV